MIKRIIQSLIPSFILNWYKESQYFKIIRDFNIKDQPDLLVAEKLVNKESLFIDIGANIGLYTKHLSPFTKQVRSYEPVPFTFDMLSKNVSKFDLKNVELNEIAISSKNGEAIIEVPIQGGARNYYRATLETSENIDSSEMKVKVPTQTIDSIFLQQANQISLIKVDVEGHELSVIQGSKHFLEKSSASWLMEISENPDDKETSAFELFKIMSSNGFEVYLYENEILRKRKLGDSSINYFFLKDEHLEKLQVFLTVGEI